jgi:hypothetical protein
MLIIEHTYISIQINSKKKKPCYHYGAIYRLNLQIQISSSSTTIALPFSGTILKKEDASGM